MTWNKIVEEVATWILESTEGWDELDGNIDRDLEQLGEDVREYIEDKLENERYRAVS